MTNQDEIALLGLETAILFDLENLIGGYGPNNYADRVDLAQLSTEIRKMGMVGRVAVKRAYANWASFTLKPLLKQVAELGIEPVQMFSMGRGNAKNASDLQIAIDAMELALSRPSIQAFIIVSGDGGFASLASRLRSHGKRVGGAAYTHARNQFFMIQCDQWAELTPPLEPSPTPKPQRPHASPATPPWMAGPRPKDQPEVASPLLEEFLGSYVRTSPADAQEMLAATVSAMNTLAGCRSAAHLLDGQGLGHGEVLECLKAGIADFSVTRAGVPKLSTLLAVAVTGTELQLIQGTSGHSRLQRRGLTPPEGHELVADVGGWVVHSPANYRSLLASAKRSTPSEVTLGQVADVLIASESASPVEEHILMEAIASALSCPEKDVRTSLHVLTRAGVLRSDVEGEKTLVVLLVRDTAEGRRLLVAHLQESLKGLLPDFRGDVLDELVG